jgi:hypothetical protein
MAASANWYGKALLGQYGTSAAGRVDWATDDIKVALCTSSYSPDQDAHDNFDDVTNEVTGAGYTAGGESLASKSVNYDDDTNTTSLRAGATSWTSATFSARYAVIYKSTGTSSTSPLLGYVDFGGDETVSSGTFSITWDTTDGVLKIVAEGSSSSSSGGGGGGGGGGG